MRNNALTLIRVTNFKSKIMGYTLVPRNKKVDDIDIGAFSWPIVLQETGAGYLLGYGRYTHNNKPVA